MYKIRMNLYNVQMFRLYIERKSGFRNEAESIYSQIKNFLGISGITGVRYINRYDIENIDEESAKIAAARIFSEPQGDICTFSKLNIDENSHVIIWEYLPGQYDQRADSAEQCLSLLLAENTGDCENPLKAPKVRCAKMVILSGSLNADDILCIKN